MILPSHLSSMVLHQLAHPSDEQIGHIQQSGYQAPTNPTRTSAPIMGVQPIQKAEAAMNMQAIAANLKPSTIDIGADVTPIRQRSMQTDNTLLMSGLGVSAVSSQNHLDDDERTTSSRVLDDMDWLEAQALQTIIKTSLSIQYEQVFTRYLVGVIYDNNLTDSVVKNTQGLKKCVLIIASLDHLQSPLLSIDIAAHSTFFVHMPHSEPRAVNLPAQLVSGTYTHSQDWFAMHGGHTLFSDTSEFIADTGRYSLSSQITRLSITAFHSQLVGNAIIVGDTGEFMQADNGISLHVPGVKRFWQAERVPPAIPPPLEAACSHY